MAIAQQLTGKEATKTAQMLSSDLDRRLMMQVGHHTLHPSPAAVNTFFRFHVRWNLKRKIRRKESASLWFCFRNPGSVHLTAGYLRSPRGCVALCAALPLCAAVVPNATPRTKLAELRPTTLRGCRCTHSKPNPHFPRVTWRTEHEHAKHKSAATQSL